MIKVEHIEVFNFEGAIRGMRNPLNSWDKSDSHMETDYANNMTKFVIGEKDLDLMRRLYKAGSEHRKYLRMIHVSMDIIAPDYFFKEFDTYRVGVTENSTSTMHKLTSKPLTIDCFSLEDMNLEEANAIVEHNEKRRLNYLEDKTEESWRSLIQGLPMSYNYRRTIDMNYENVITMIHQRSGHKLSEWRTFVTILKDLPYIKEITNE